TGKSNLSSVPLAWSYGRCTEPAVPNCTSMPIGLVTGRPAGTTTTVVTLFVRVRIALATVVRAAVGPLHWHGGPSVANGRNLESGVSKSGLEPPETIRYVS